MTENNDEFVRKLNVIIEYYNSFRTHAEQRRNELRMLKETAYDKRNVRDEIHPFSPSEKVELEHLEKLIDSSNELFPYALQVQKFKEEVLKNHGG